MNRPVLTTLLTLALAAPPAATLLAGCSKKPKNTAGCSKDTDCKGDRVCEKGTCVMPDQVPAKGPLGAFPGASPGRPVPGGKAAPTPGGPGTPRGPGGILIPGGPRGPGSGGPGGALAGMPPIKICVGAKCVTMGPNFGNDPGDMAKLFELARGIMLDGLNAKPGASPKTKIEVCVGTQCVTLDDSLKNNPMALLKLFSQLGPTILQQLMQQGFGPGGLFGGPHTRRGPPPGSRRGLPPIPPSPRAAPPGATSNLLKDFDAIAQAGAHAVGREAELADLSVTSVSDDRVVLEGPGREMIVLKITAAHRKLVPQLRMATGKVALRLRILSPPVGKILHGELLAVK